MSISIFLILFSFSVSLLAAYLDFRNRIIPNKLIFPALGVVIVSTLFLSLGVAGLHWQSLLVGVLVGSGLFYAKLWGGGDAKLLMLQALSVPADQVVSLLLCIFIAGGLQAVVWRLIWPQQKSLPYGLGMAFGYGVWAVGQLAISN